MRTVQMTLDEALVDAVDQEVSTLGTTRSAFARDALREALRRNHVRRLEAQHRQGYEQAPVQIGEFDAWEDEQAWGDP